MVVRVNRAQNRANYVKFKFDMATSVTFTLNPSSRSFKRCKIRLKYRRRRNKASSFNPREIICLFSCLSLTVSLSLPLSVSLCLSLSLSVYLCVKYKSKLLSL